MDWLPQFAWVGALLFARLGTILMLAPGWGEQAAPAQLRLAAALLATAALAPSVVTQAPALPAFFLAGVPMLVSEILVGLMMGGAARIMMSAFQVAGAITGLSSGLSFAQQVDPMAGESSAIFSAFFSMMAVVIIMGMGLHRVMIEAAVDSYRLFPPGQTPRVGDASEWAVEAVSASFKLGFQIAAPVLVFSLVFNLGLALVARLIPQIQVFMIAMPAQVILSLIVVALGLSGGLVMWLDAMDRQMRFLPPG